jgi:hypothetical protein
MPTLPEFVNAQRIMMTAEPTDSNPSMEPDRNPMDHWKCKLTRTDKDGRRSLTIIFSMGMGHSGKQPHVNDVLDCLASDASSYDNAQGFEDWAADFGLDPDSRKAERTYKAVQVSAAKLKRFLGDEAYETLLYKTERE